MYYILEQMDVVQRCQILFLKSKITALLLLLFRQVTIIKFYNESGCLINASVEIFLVLLIFCKIFDYHLAQMTQFSLLKTEGKYFLQGFSFQFFFV